MGIQLSDWVENIEENRLKRVTQGTFLWNYLQIWPGVWEKKIFWEFLHVGIVQKVSPPHGGHVFRLIKISQTVFKKGHPRNNPVELFQNLTSGFRVEEFWRISLKSTQWKKPPPHPHPSWWSCFSTDQNFANNFWKGSHRNNPVKLFQNRTRGFRGEDFSRIP